MTALTTSWLRATEVLETYIFNVSLRVKCRLQKLFSTNLGICVDISGSTFSGYRKVGSLVKQIFFPMHLHLKVSRRFLSPGFSFLFLSWENHLKLSASHCISVSECQKIGHVFSQLVSYCIRQCCATLLNWILIVFTARVFANFVNIWWCYSPGVELCYMNTQIQCLCIKVQSLQ